MNPDRLYSYLPFVPWRAAVSHNPHERKVRRRGRYKQTRGAFGRPKVLMLREGPRRDPVGQGRRWG